MKVSIPPRFEVSAAATAAMVVTQRTAPKPAAANPDSLIIASLLYSWDGSVAPSSGSIFRQRSAAVHRGTLPLDGIQRTSLQATQWPGRTSRSSGRIRLQLSTAIGQRG